MTESAMLVTLDWDDLAEAAHIGLDRQLNAVRKGYKDRVVAGREVFDPYRTHVEGAIAECAVSKVLQVPWSKSIDTFKGPDCGENIQVRYSRTSDLIVRQRDNLQHIYVLVTGGERVGYDVWSYEIEGWIYGIEVERLGSWRNPHGHSPAWFVHRSRLHDIRDLINNLKNAVDNKK